MALIEDATAALMDLRAGFEGPDEVGCHVFLYAQRGREKRDRWKRVSMDGDLASRFVDATRESIVDLQAGLGDRPIDEFDFDVMATGSVGVIATDDVESVGDWLNELPDEDWAELFRGDSQYLDKVRFYATRINFSDGKVLRLFRNKRGIDIILETSRGISAFFQQDAAEMRPVEGMIVNFDQRIDFFEWDGFIYVCNLGAFESLTNIRAVTISRAAQAMDTFARRFQVANVDAIKNKLANSTKLSKKLAAAAQHGVIEDVDGDALIERIAEKGIDLSLEKRGN